MYTSSQYINIISINQKQKPKADVYHKDMKYNNENVKPYAKFPTHTCKKPKAFRNFLTMGLDVLSPITYDCGNYNNYYFIC
jgi:hypothetical protein